MSFALISTESTDGINSTCVSALFCWYIQTESDMGIIAQQIYQLGLKVNAAWVGSRLHEIVSSRYRVKKPTLFFGMKPSTLTASYDFVRLPFPYCENTNSVCDYEVSRSYFTALRILSVKFRQSLDLQCILGNYSLWHFVVFRNDTWMQRTVTYSCSQLWNLNLNLI